MCQFIHVCSVLRQGNGFTLLRVGIVLFKVEWKMLGGEGYCRRNATATWELHPDTRVTYDGNERCFSLFYICRLFWKEDTIITSTRVLGQPLPPLISYSSPICPFSKQQTNTLSIMCSSDTLCDSRTNIKRNEFRTSVFVLLLGYSICNLGFMT